MKDQLKQKTIDPDVPPPIIHSLALNIWLLFFSPTNPTLLPFYKVTVAMSSEGWQRTGLRSDVTQHALVIPVLTSHIRFHRCLKELEKIIDYSFKDRRLLQVRWK